MFAGRYLRFFPATITVPNAPNLFDLDVGHFFDLLVAYNYQFKLNGLEIGLDQNFIFGGKLCPPPSVPTPLQFIEYLLLDLLSYIFT